MRGGNGSCGNNLSFIRECGGMNFLGVMGKEGAYKYRYKRNNLRAKRCRSRERYIIYRRVQREITCGGASGREFRGKLRTCPLHTHIFSSRNIYTYVCWTDKSSPLH